MKKILRIKTSHNVYGGNSYENELVKCLRKDNEIDEIIPVSNVKSRLKYFFVFSFFYQLFKISNFKQYDYVIRALETSFFLSSHTKNIVIAHHYDVSYSNIFSKTMQYLAFKNLLFQKNKVDTLIVVSKYWEDFFSQYGFTNIKVIYNSFDTVAYSRSEDEISVFRNKYNLLDKKIIYIGNPQRKKGSDEVYEILKDENYYLLTSGTKELDLGTIHLNLDHHEYITLLASSDLVVLNSKFKEGWNRVAHEALLCKTPVIGSGRGGMGELLEKAKQEKFTVDTELKSKIQKVFTHYDLYKNNGYLWAVKYDLNRFCREINKVLK